MQHSRGVIDQYLTQRPAAGLHRSPMIDQLKHSAPRDMIVSFEEAVKKLACRAVVKTADNTSTSSMLHQRQVSDTEKELWQSLAQATSQKRSPASTKPPDSDSEKSISKEVESSGGKVAGVTASVTEDGSEVGDRPSNASPAVGIAVTKQVKSVVELSPETGAGDAKSATAVSGGWAGWQAVDRDSAAAKLGDESFGSGLGLEAGALDASEVVSGEESFYSVTSDDHHPVTESQTAAEVSIDDANVDDDSDLDDDDDDDADDDDATHVDEAETQNGMMWYDTCDIFILACFFPSLYISCVYKLAAYIWRDLTVFHGTQTDLAWV